MSILEPNRPHLDAMRLVEGVSQSLGVTSWVWGGYVTDIHVGRILREHDDIDYLTLDLHPLRSKIEEVFSACGWQTKYLENGDLSLKKEGVKVHLGNVERYRLARWTHNGEKGSLHFPLSWLNPETIIFYETKIHVVAPELQYVLKNHPEYLNPNWTSREKDLLDIDYLRNMLLQKGEGIRSLQTLVISR